MAANEKVKKELAEKIKEVRNLLDDAYKTIFDDYLEQRNGRLRIMLQKTGDIKTYWVGILDKFSKPKTANLRGNRKLSDIYYLEHETEQLQDAFINYAIAKAKLQIICEKCNKNFDKVLKIDGEELKEVQKARRTFIKELTGKTAIKKDKKSLIFD